MKLFVCLCWGLTSQSTIFQSCRDRAIASLVINQYFRGVKCLAQGHNTAAVGFEPPTSRSGVRHSTTEPLRSPVQWNKNETYVQEEQNKDLNFLHTRPEFPWTRPGFQELSSYMRGCKTTFVHDVIFDILMSFSCQFLPNVLTSTYKRGAEPNISW